MGEVKLSNIRKTYKGGSEVVKGISFEVKDKEFIVLVGPSGCGKSTVLRMIAGLEEITEGDLFIGKTKVNDVAASERGIAMVFQNYALYPHMNSYENMAFGLKIKKVPKEEIKERVMAAAKILNVESLLDRKPGKMSGGQRQRIAIGRAIVRRPEVFLFDEPLSNLDAKLRGKMRIELAKLHRRLDTTMIYVTHDQVEAMTLGERIIVMKDGVIMQIDSPIKLFNDPKNKFVAEFIGSPQMNFFDGRIEIQESKLIFKDKNGNTFDLSKLKLNNLKENIGKEIYLGIRSVNLRDEKGILENYATLKGEVIAIELLGNQKHIYVEYNDIEIIATFRSEVEVKLNSHFELFLNLNKAYFFDKETGIRIY
ncbi:MAG: sn-glycerol-3-phosphate ABC transporter ATP-binding protein UgpC [Flavobacteriaceae bacterium]|nr:sn-glycerol-3-phosphate ABC transporter ATP-binding protein UgpC [Flavobacteriaceae bacterium]